MRIMFHLDFSPVDAGERGHIGPLASRPERFSKNLPSKGRAEEPCYPLICFFFNFSCIICSLFGCAVSSLQSLGFSLGWLLLLWRRASEAAVLGLSRWLGTCGTGA